MNETTPQETAPTGTKKPYESPALIKHGTVRDLTLMTGLNGTDNPNGTPPIGSNP